MATRCEMSATMGCAEALDTVQCCLTSGTTLQRELRHCPFFTCKHAVMHKNKVIVRNCQVALEVKCPCQGASPQKPYNVRVSIPKDAHLWCILYPRTTVMKRVEVHPVTSGCMNTTVRGLRSAAERGLPLSSHRTMRSSSVRYHVHAVWSDVT